MVNITCKNIDTILDKYSRINAKSEYITMKVALYVAKKMRNDILQLYQSLIPEWQSEEYSKLQLIDGKDVTVVPSGDRVFVTIGENTDKFYMPRKTKQTNQLFSDTYGEDYLGLPHQVNPYFFIEFGFGISGQEAPIENANDFHWLYNIKKHKDEWLFKGYDGQKHYGIGVKGVGAINEVHLRFPDYVRQAVNEVLKNV